MLLVDGRSDDQLALQVADDAARQDVRRGDRVVVATAWMLSSANLR